MKKRNVISKSIGLNFQAKVGIADTFELTTFTLASMFWALS